MSHKMNINIKWVERKHDWVVNVEYVINIVCL